LESLSQKGPAYDAELFWVVFLVACQEFSQFTDRSGYVLLFNSTRQSRRIIIVGRHTSSSTLDTVRCIPNRDPDDEKHTSPPAVTGKTYGTVLRGHEGSG